MLSQDILRTCPGSRSIKGLPWRVFKGFNLKTPSTERDTCIEGAHRKLNQFAILARCMPRRMQLHVHVILVESMYIYIYRYITDNYMLILETIYMS